jgi:drug/metabolite transporter (DMT)-like permease
MFNESFAFFLDLVGWVLFSFYMTKTLIVMGLAVVAGAIGDLLLSKGMKEVGDASAIHFQTIVPFIKKVAKCSTIWMGTACLTIFFILWLTVLSWAELSLVLPLTAATFVLGPILAQIFLGEQVIALRWMGTVLISLGVVLVTLKS